MKKLLLLVLLLPSALFGTDPLKPLSESTARVLRKDGDVDFVELGYVGARSYALYICVAGYLEESSTTEEPKLLAKAYKEKADVFLAIALVASKKIEMSNEYLKQRIALLVNAYTTEMVENKKLNNNAISEFINADMTAAKEVFPLYDSLAKKTDSTEAAKK